MEDDGACLIPETNNEVVDQFYWADEGVVCGKGGSRGGLILSHRGASSVVRDLDVYSRPAVGLEIGVFDNGAKGPSLLLLSKVLGPRKGLSGGLCLRVRGGLSLSLRLCQCISPSLGHSKALGLCNVPCQASGLGIVFGLIIGKGLGLLLLLLLLLLFVNLELVPCLLLLSPNQIPSPFFGF